MYYVCTLVLVERVYECVDVEEDSEDTDFSGEEDNPGEADTHTQILSETIHPQVYNIQTNDMVF